MHTNNNGAYNAPYEYSHSNEKWDKRHAGDTNERPQATVSETLAARFTISIGEPRSLLPAVITTK